MEIRMAQQKKGASSRPVRSKKAVASSPKVKKSVSAEKSATAKSYPPKVHSEKTHAEKARSDKTNSGKTHSANTNSAKASLKALVTEAKASEAKIKEARTKVAPKANAKSVKSPVMNGTIEKPAVIAAPSSLPPQPAAITAKSRSSRKIAIDAHAGEAAAQLVQKWNLLYKKADQIDVKPYSMKAVFEEKTAIMHKVLGWGYILANRNDRLEVLFKDGIKYLISNYKP